MVTERSFGREQYKHVDLLGTCINNTCKWARWQLAATCRPTSTLVVCRPTCSWQQTGGDVKEINTTVREHMYVGTSSNILVLDLSSTSAVSAAAWTAQRRRRRPPSPLELPSPAAAVLIPFVPADCIAARSGRQYRSRGCRPQIKIERRPSCWLPRLRPGFAALVAPPRPSAGPVSFAIAILSFRGELPILFATTVRVPAAAICAGQIPLIDRLRERISPRADVAALVNLDAVHVRIVRIAGRQRKQFFICTEIPRRGTVCAGKGNGMLGWLGAASELWRPPFCLSFE